MNKSFCLVLILALLQSSLAVIKPRQTINVPQNIPLAQGDSYEISSNTFFDMSQADLKTTNIEVSQGPLQNLVKINGAILGGGGYKSHYTYMDQFDDVGEITNTIFISNTTYLVIFDNSSLTYFASDPNSQEITRVWTADLSVKGQTVTCYDATSGHNSGYENHIYVVCHLVNTKDQKKFIEVFAIDKQNGYFQPPESKEVGVSFKVENRLEIGFYNISVPGSQGRSITSPYLVVYSQGRDKLAPQAAGDKYVKFYSFISPAVVTFNSDAKIIVPTTTVTTLYDVFAWAESIIITSINSVNPNLVVMSSCIVDSAMENLTCATQDSVYTTSPTGYIGLGHTHGEIAIFKPTNGLSGNLAVYDISGTFPDKWLTKNTEYNYTLPKALPVNSYPKDYIGNNSGGVIQFVGNTAKDQCIIAHSDILNDTYWYGESTAVYQSRTLLVIDVYAPSQQQSHIRTSAYRLDYPFAVVKSSLLNDQADNNFQVKITDISSTVTDIRNVYKINTESVVPQIDYIPPRFDSYDLSTITFPFFDVNVISGNNLRYQVDFQTKDILPDDLQNIFSKSDSRQKFGLDVSFNTAASFNNFKKMAWTQGAAIVQSNTQAAFVLYCNYPSEQVIDCGEATEFTLPDNYTLREYAVSDQGFIIGSAVNSTDGRTILIVSSLSNRSFQLFPLQIYNKDFFPEDINIFSYEYMDDQGIVQSSFYISAATFNRDTRAGRVYIFQLNKKNLLVDPAVKPKLLKTMDDQTTNLSYFCPTQVRHNRDPVNHGGRLIHVLSNCAAYGIQHQSPVIVQFQVVDVIRNGTLEQLVTEEVIVNNDAVTGTNTTISFCSLNGHYLILENGVQSEGNSNLYRIMKKNSFGRYNIHLTLFNMRTLRELNCLPYTNQYTLKGYTENSQTVYGVFSGSNIYNNLKFVDYIFIDEYATSNERVNFFAINDYVLQVTYGNNNFYSAILNNPPKLRVNVGYINDKDFHPTAVPYTIKVWESDNRSPKQQLNASDPQVTVNGIITIQKPVGDIQFEINGIRKNESGWKDLEASFTRPVGNLFGVKVEGAYAAGVMISDRKTNFGGLGLEGNSKLFTQYFGDDTHGIGLTIDGGFGLFSLCNSTSIINSAILPGIQGFHADRLDVDGSDEAQAIVIAQYGETRGRGITVFAIGQKFVSNFETRYASCDKIRIADGGNNVNFLGLCLDKDTQLLRVWTITLTGQTISITEKDMDNFLSFDKVIDFDVTSVKNSGTDIFFISSETSLRSSINLQQTFYSSSKGWDKSSPLESYQPYKLFGTDPTRSYILSGITAHLNDESTNSQHNIAVTTYGTKIFGVDLIKDPAKGSKSKWIDINQYVKPAGFDGIEMRVTNDWIALKGNRLIHPMDTGIFVYKYGKKEDSFVFTSLDLSGDTMGGVPPVPTDDEPVPPGRLSNLPFTVFKHESVDVEGNQVTKTVIAHGSSDPRFPIVYRAIDNMKIFIPDKITNDDLSSVQVTFDSYNPIQVTVKQLLTGTTPGPHPGPGPAPEKSAYWPFLLILLILFLGAIGWFIYVRTKVGHKDQEPDNYNSLKNQETVMSGAYAKTGMDTQLKSEKLEDDEDALS